MDQEHAPSPSFDLPANLPARGISSTDFVGRPPCRAHGGVGSGAGSWDLPQACPSHVWDESAAWDRTREVGIIRQRHCRSSVDVLDRGISRRTHPDLGRSEQSPPSRRRGSGRLPAARRCPVRKQPREEPNRLLRRRGSRDPTRASHEFSGRPQRAPSANLRRSPQTHFQVLTP